MAASSKTNFDVARAMATEDTRRSAAELLSRPIRQNSDFTPLEIGRLHGLVCPGATTMGRDGKRSEGVVGAREGAFRAKPVYVMGTDWVMKEGAPPKQIVGELMKIFDANRAARQRGVSSVLRGAWLLYAFGVVHPFYDGNGKVGRMLASTVMVRGGRLPLIIPPRFHRAFFDTVADARNGRPQMLLQLVAECQVALMESALAALT
jgi:Fic family protein